ncbi:MAG: amidohydrolase family protein [Deltaproteobacteria bacterium]|nr:amidohydrolase family protein [Deltaproteobacteria bacterium]
MRTAPRPRHIPVRKDWLALRNEPAFEPDRPIVDAHHHLWDKPGASYSAADMAEDMAGHTIVATVFVECGAFYRPAGDRMELPLGETEAVVAMAETHAGRGGGQARIAAGIVGYVDLTAGAGAGVYLDRHMAAGRGRFKGVRNTTAWHADPNARGSVVLPPPGLLYDPGFRKGLAELAARDLVFDAWMYHTQLGELYDLARAMPDLKVVLDHQGGPLGIGPYAGRRNDVFADWEHFMGRLSDCPNIAVKLGGFGMLMSGFDFYDHPLPPASDALCEAWSPYFLRCVALFGADRCMFESNFPVDKGMVSYTVLWNAFKKIAASRSESEKHQLFFETANRTYSLGLNG